MSRLDIAEKRLHDAICRLEKSIESCVVGARDDAVAETELRARISNLEFKRDVMEKRMETAGKRLDVMIERLRGLLGE